MDYYTLVKDKNGYMYHFTNEWNLKMNSIDLQQAYSKQLNNGNRLRPLLFYWGYTLAENIHSINLSKIAKTAIPIEMIHKASIIVDDLIDNDITRNGDIAFHKEFDMESTIVFSNYLVAESLNEFINNGSFAESNDRTIYTIKKLANCVSDMTLGCMQELNLNKNDYGNKAYIDSILCKETVSLISNSLLLGFLSNKNSNAQLEEIVYKIGELYGYIFQVLNDLEPYSNIATIEKSKTNVNLDICRKNIIFATIYDCSTILEKQKITKIINNEVEDKDYIYKLFKKYKIKEITLRNIEQTKALADEYVLKLYNENYLWCENFELFLYDVFKHCLNRV